jgi:hypothetical protein
MKITPELLTALGYVRDRFGGWHCKDLDFDAAVTEYEYDGGDRLYTFGCTPVETADELLNCIFAAGVEEGRRRAAGDLRRLMGLREEDRPCVK